MMHCDFHFSCSYEEQHGHGYIDRDGKASVSSFEFWIPEPCDIELFLWKLRQIRRFNFCSTVAAVFCRFSCTGLVFTFEVLCHCACILIRRNLLVQVL